MKNHIQQLIEQSLTALQDNGVIPVIDNVSIQVERARDSKHGDYACNVAMALAKLVQQKPRELAEKIVNAIPQSEQIENIEIAGPGFINFYLIKGAVQSVVHTVLTQGERFGQSLVGRGKRIQVEFVSANPTGPLHVGHGRGAAYGAALSNLLAVAGYQVQREYYVNDAGRQMDILAASVWLRYLELCGEAVDFPSNGYKGDYVFDIAASLHRDYSEKFRSAPMRIFTDIPQDARADGSGDKEAHIDAVVERAKEILGNTDYRTVFDAGLNYILEDIKQDLAQFGVEYDEWFSERALMESGAVDKAIATLKQNGHVYDKGGNLWFKSTDFGDEKDRVIVRENGSKTYFASDIAYHLHKFERGFNELIDIWGADHHGYVARVKAAVQAMAKDPARLEVLLVQFAVLYRGTEKVQMSTRSGEFVTLRELRKDVGNDAARFFYVMRKCEQHMDFDLELAKSQSNDNPVYYIQYAHARICSVMREMQSQGLQYNQAQGFANLQSLTESHEERIFTQLSRYPEVIESAALNREPHQIAHYLRELANDLHTYYNAHKFIVDDAAKRDARITLILAIKQVIANGLTILGVSTPEAM